MSDTQRTPIVDKNGKPTHVHKSVAPNTKDSRLSDVATAPPLFYDDPYDTSSEVYDRITDGVKTLAGLIVTYAESDDFDQLARLSGKMNALAETADMWSNVAKKSKSLGEAKSAMITALAAKMEALDNGNTSEYAGYSLAVDYLRSAEPVRPSTLVGR